ncbi:MAG TPA: hypothetical protein VMU88_07710 [bacterium]|nr:hypothetical protein [bacterium]
MSDYDLGFHLRGGQWIFHHRSFFTHDEYTYTVPNHPYLDIHWFFQVLIFGLYALGGYGLIGLWNTALVGGLFWVHLNRLRLTGAPEWMALPLFLATLAACEPRFEVRPEILSWLFLSITLWVLELRTAKSRDLLFLLPWVHLLWANVEGLFPLGWVAMAAYALRSFLQDAAPDRKLILVAAISIMACGLTPHFLQGLLFPLVQFNELGPSSFFKQAIGEFQPSWASRTASFVPPVSLWTYKGFSFFLLFLLLAAPKARKVQDLLLALAFFYLSACAIRNIPLFMLAATPFAASLWKAVPWEKWRKTQTLLLARPAAAWITTALLLAWGVWVATGGYYRWDKRGESFGIGLDTQKQPVRAAQYLVDHQLNGRILNQLNWGGWLDWRGPQETFIDGRLEVMGEDFYREYLSSYQGGLAALADKYGAEIIFFSPPLSNWQGELRANPGWRPVYWDGLIAVYLRAGYRPDIPALPNNLN